MAILLNGSLMPSSGICFSPLEDPGIWPASSQMPPLRSLLREPSIQSRVAVLRLLTESLRRSVRLQLVGLLIKTVSRPHCSHLSVQLAKQ